VRQILVNLLGNAVKFTEAGSVALRVGWSDGRATFDVSDTGYGIAGDELGTLFDAFAQTESGRRSSEGTGLGLALSRSFARAMGGEIGVRSQLGHGSTFTVELPLPAAEAAASDDTPGRVVGLAPGTPSPRVLVVDDTHDNRVLLRELLEPIGFDVREASNGAEAVEVWQSWRPEIILMDMRMPVMSGVEATREIRRRESVDHRGHGEGDSVSSVAETSPVRIVALTASAFEHEREQIVAHGCDAFVAKPFRESTVFATLAEQLGIGYVYATPDAEPGKSESAITTARLTGVSAEWRERFEESLVTGDVQALLEAADALAPHDEQLAAELRKAVREYRFDELLDELKGFHHR
jgi:CheY-like chemotaxis protein